MATYEQIMEIFAEYLAEAPHIEVVRAKWGYVRLFYEEPYADSFEAVLCRTPEELFEVLLSHVLAEQAERFSRLPLEAEGKEAERYTARELKKTELFYRERLRERGERDTQ